MKRGPVPRLEEHAQAALSHEEHAFDTGERKDVDEIIRESCGFRGWPVHALQVRSNHVHLVVTSTKTPEDVMRVLKARVTRVLRERGVLGAEEPLWTRHGSTVYLFKQAQLERAIWYTLEAQDGERFEMPE